MERFIRLLFMLLVFTGCQEIKKKQKDIVVEEVEEKESAANAQEEKQVEQDKISSSIAALIDEDPELSNYNLLLQKADLAEMLLDENASYTIFASCNDVLEEIKKSDMDNDEAVVFCSSYIFNRSLPYKKLKAETTKNQQQLLLENIDGSYLRFIEKEGAYYIKMTSGKLLKIEKPEKASNGFLYKLKLVK